jgi:uncharacterized protein
VSLNVLAITDEVSRTLYDAFKPERWRDVDLIVSCGDLHPEYLDFLVTNLDVPIFYIRGNHDGDYRTSQYDGLRNIHGKIVEYKGIRIAGFEGSLRYNYGPVQYSERQMRRIFRRMRIQSIFKGAPDLIVTHAPPAGPHSGHDQCHGGFETFNLAMEVWHPSVLVHGHMHAYDGAQEPYTFDGTDVLNAYPYTQFQIGERAPKPVEVKQAPVPTGVKRFLSHHRAH